MAFVLASFGSVEASTQGSPDLQSGLVRFALAGADLAPVIKLAERLDGDSGQLLRARVLLRTGHTEEGLALLNSVADGQHHRAEAALILGQHLAAADQHAEARRWFQRSVAVGYGEIRQEAAYRLAELELEQGRTEKAGEVLAAMEPGFWAAIGYLNLSGEHARADLNPTRALVALRVALAMAEADSDSKRRADLENRLRLRAGYLALENGEFDKAIGFLEKVSLESDSTPHALYLHGLALAEKGNHRASMQSWHRSKKFPLAFPGVTEAWIAMGRGFDLSGYLGQAGEAYLAANAAFESERVTLRKLAERIEREGAYKALVEDARASDLEWFLADSRTLTQPRLAYLIDFLTSAKAQRAVSRVSELKELGLALTHRRTELAIFRENLQSQVNALRARTDSRTHATTNELRKTQDTLEGALANLVGQSLTSTQQRQLAELKDTLAASARSLSSLDQRLASRPASLRSQLTLTRTLHGDTQRLAERVIDLTRQAEQRLDSLALAYVQEQDAEMVAALDKTEQQIAHLYEYLALQNLEGVAQ